MEWSGPGILISLPLLVLVSITLLTVLVTASTTNNGMYWQPGSSGPHLTRSNRHGYFEFYEDGSGSRGHSGNAGMEANLQTRTHLRPSRVYSGRDCVISAKSCDGNVNPKLNYLRLSCIHLHALNRGSPGASEPLNVFPSVACQSADRCRQPIAVT